MKNFEKHYFDKKKERFKTSLQVAMIYAIIAALIAFVLNFDKLIMIIKKML